MGKITDKINGWGNGFGVWFRFITPIFLGLLIWNFTFFQGYVKENFIELKNCFENHLQHHATFELQIENRLTELKTNQVAVMKALDKIQYKIE